MIKYIDNVDNISSDKLKGFFVGWPNPPSEEKHLEILEKSAHIWVAIDDETDMVIGFINAISDGVISAYIPLLEVVPEYQKRGIGRQLTEKMVKTLEVFYMVDLLCDENMNDYYKKFDFFSANAMIMRNYDRQNGESS